MTRIARSQDARLGRNGWQDPAASPDRGAHIADESRPSLEGLSVELRRRYRDSTGASDGGSCGLLEPDALPGRCPLMTAGRQHGRHGRVRLSAPWLVAQAPESTRVLLDE